MKIQPLTGFRQPLAGAILLATLATTTAETFEWALNDTSPEGGNWSLTTAAGWVSPGTYPNAADDIARVFKNIGTNQTITINVNNAKVGTLFLQDNQSGAGNHWDIATSNAATNFLTFETTSGNALLDIDERNGGGAVTISAPIKLNSQLEIRVDPTVGALVSGAIADGSASHGIIKTGGQLLTLGGVNTYTGTTTINAGILRIFADSALGTAPASPVADSITLNGGTLDTRGPGNFEIASTRGITLGASGGTWSTTTPNSSHVATYNGIITGPGSLTKSSGQTLVLGGDNTFTGGLIITGGSLRLANAGALNATTPNTVSISSGFLDLNGHSVTIAGLSGAGGNVRNNVATAATLTVNKAAGTDTFAGTLLNAAGALSLVKDGAGTLELIGTNTYSGSTTVAKGSLVINGDHSGATGSVSVAGTGTLAGSGIIGGATTLDGLHAPGNSPGIQTFTAGLAYNPTATLVWELWANTAAPADRGVNLTGYDGVDLTGGSLAVDGLATIDISLAGTADLANAFWNASQSWLVIDLQDTATAADSNVFTLGAITLNGTPFDPTSFGEFSLVRAAGSTTETGVWLEWTAVPEPAMPLLSALALALAGLRRRRP